MASALSVVLALSLLPAPAFAGELAAGRQHVSAQAGAKKASVYVLTGATVTERGGSTTGGKDIKATFKFSYNGNGLLTSRDARNGYFVTARSKLSFSYSKGRVAKAVEQSWDKSGAKRGSGSYSAGYDKKNRLVKVVHSASGALSATAKLSRDARGRVSKIKIANGGRTTVLSYDKKGRVKKHLTTGMVGSMAGSQAKVRDTQTFSWDKNGGLAASSYQAKRDGWLWYTLDEEFSSTYRGKRLVKSSLKRTIVNNTGPWTDVVRVVATFQYKRISVPKKLVAQVEAQQWSLLNRNANYELPCDAGKVSEWGDTGMVR